MTEEEISEEIKLWRKNGIPAQNPFGEIQGSFPENLENQILFYGNEIFLISQDKRKGEGENFLVCEALENLNGLGLPEKIIEELDDNLVAIIPRELEQRTFPESITMLLEEDRDDLNGYDIALIAKILSETDIPDEYLGLIFHLLLENSPKIADPRLDKRCTINVFFPAICKLKLLFAKQTALPSSL